MDCLRSQPLTGILINATKNKLTPVSSDVFISIPDRDLPTFPTVRFRLSLRLAKIEKVITASPSIPDLFDKLNKSVS